MFLGTSPVDLTRYATARKHQTVLRSMASKTSIFYRNNPEAAEKRRRWQRKENKKKKKRLYRAFLMRKNREAGTDGNGDGLDYDHTERRFMKAKRNRSKK